MEFKDSLILIGSLIALLTFIKGVYEYSKNNTMKRAEYFSTLQSELHNLIQKSRIGEMLEHDSPEISTLTYYQKVEFLGYYEKVALMLNSGLLRKEVAHYMFAYHAILCNNNKTFWKHMNQDSPYWSLFCNFSRQMEEIRKTSMKVNFNASHLKF